jgi:hypothetical protein
MEHIFTKSSTGDRVAVADGFSWLSFFLSAFYIGIKSKSWRQFGLVFAWNFGLSIISGLITGITSGIGAASGDESISSTLVILGGIVNLALGIGLAIHWGQVGYEHVKTGLIENGYVEAVIETQAQVVASKPVEKTSVIDPDNRIQNARNEINELIGLRDIGALSPSQFEIEKDKVLSKYSIGK